MCQPMNPTVGAAVPTDMAQDAGTDLDQSLDATIEPDAMVLGPTAVDPRKHRLLQQRFHRLL